MDFNTGLARGPANHQPLTPLLFLERAAAVFPDHLAVVHGTLRRSYRELRARCNGGWRPRCWRRGIEPGDVVAALCRTSRRWWRRTTACRWPARC